MGPTQEEFGEAVRQRFEFLEAQGFTFEPSAAPLDREGDLSVARYLHPTGAFVEVVFIRRDNSTGMKVGRRSSPRDALTDAELRLIEGAPSTPPTFPLGRDRDRLAYLAWLLENYGSRVLAGDPAIFEEVRVLRQRETERYI